MIISILSWNSKYTIQILYISYTHLDIISGANGDLFTQIADPEMNLRLREFEIKIIFDQIAHAILVSVYNVNYNQSKFTNNQIVSS